MFEERVTSGKHMMCDIKEINNECLLNNSSKLKEVLDNICIKYNFDVLNKTHHDFNPQGCSILFLLSESHMSVHTFPEKNYISFDIYTCREYENNNDYEEIFYYLVKILDASNKSTFHIIDRYF